MGLTADTRAQLFKDRINFPVDKLLSDSLNVCKDCSIFARVQANMQTLTTARFGSVRKPWTTFNVKYILDPE